MARTIYYIEIHYQDDHIERGFYTSLRAMVMDNQEILPVSYSYLEKHDWKQSFQKENVFIMKSVAYTTSEVKRFN